MTGGGGIGNGAAAPFFWETENFMALRTRAATLSLTVLGAAALSACASVPAPQPVAVTPGALQILALNDFHGNLEPSAFEVRYHDDASGSEQRAVLGGAARMAATLDRLRQEQPFSVTVAAGDLVGGSPLSSAYFLDEPAIAALNQMGLQVASVGNHEFDRGTVELRRLQDGGCAQHTARTPCALDDFGGADFSYLAGNVVDQAGKTLFPAGTIRDFGALRVGFIGLTLKDTGKLVSPAGTVGYRFLGEAETANRVAADLRRQGADEVVLLIHEGGDVDPYYNTGGCPDLSGAIVPILDALDPQIRLVVSGHTHKAYICTLAKPGQPDRLLTSAGRYGNFVTDISASVEPETRRFAVLSARNVPVTAQGGEKAETAAMVARYVAATEPIAMRVVGSITGDAAGEEGCFERWTESLVADAQLAASSPADKGGAEIAFINQYGVRTPLEPGAGGSVTFGQLFAMQPFGNTLVVLEMTGDQLRRVLEEQFCGEGIAEICFSHLTPSAGFTYAFDASRPAGSRVTGMALDGKAVDPAGTYRVTVNNFLASGGDGFSVFTEARPVGDAGVDVDALENYLGAGDVTVPACGRVADQTRT